MPQLTQRDTFQQGKAQPAQVSLNQFGNPVPNLDIFNTTGETPFPNLSPTLPLTPTEFSGLHGGLHGIDIGRSPLFQNGIFNHFLRPL